MKNLIKIICQVLLSSRVLCEIQKWKRKSGNAVCNSPNTVFSAQKTKNKNMWSMPFVQTRKGYSFPQILVTGFFYNHFFFILTPRTSKLNLLLSYPNAILKCFNLKTHIYSVEMGARRLFVPVITICKLQSFIRFVDSIISYQELHCNEKKKKIYFVYFTTN